MKSQPHLSAARWRTIAATKWRYDVAMGASPWKWNTCPKRPTSPEGTTGTSSHVAPLGLLALGSYRHHGLTPVATTCRPGGTKRGSQFARSAELEQAIQANLRGLGYGG